MTKKPDAMTEFAKRVAHESDKPYGREARATEYRIDHACRQIVQIDSYGNHRYADLNDETHNHVAAMLNHLQAAYLSDQINAESFNAQRRTLLWLAFSVWESRA